MDALVRRIDAQGVVDLTADDMRRLLSSARLLVEDDTGLSGPIRVLELEGRILVQEQDDRGEHLLRGVESMDAAHRFVAQRLAAYERMWDG